MTASEFAKAAGVTVRTLHHYDRVGLLRPARRGDAGYRSYAGRDFERMEQIQVLKFLGMPLGQIRTLLEKGSSELILALRTQRCVLEEKRRHLDRALAAIEAAERNPTAQSLQTILKVIEMQNETNWTEKYYDAEARAKVEERKTLWNPELQERVSRQWAELTAEVKDAMAAGEATDSPVAQALAARWKALVTEFTAGDPGIHAGLNRMYQDRANWPAEQAQPAPFDENLMAWIRAAMRG